MIRSSPGQLVLLIKVENLGKIKKYEYKVFGGDTMKPILAFLVTWLLKFNSKS
jgi:hypothetical protein